MMRVCELYSGMGGMHFALKECGVDAEVVKAVDINPLANSVYRHNFPETEVLEKNIQSLTENEFKKLQVDMILMSPPCQPHTRTGHQKDDGDPRSNSLLHVIRLIPKLETVKYILLENVKGFENSTVRQELVEVLTQTDYTFQEFLLTPMQFAIPNSRLRYYLLAKRKPLEFCFTIQNYVMDDLPPLKADVELELYKMRWKYEKLRVGSACFKVGLILDKDANTVIPDNVLKKYATILDIVLEESVGSCCFTKGYGHYVKGTGSVFSSRNHAYIDAVFKKIKNHPKNSDCSLDLLKSLQLRYFTPREISKFMCFPDDLKFPDNLTNKQKYRLLGNSVNVHIVALLIKLLVS